MPISFYSLFPKGIVSPGHLHSVVHHMQKLAVAEVNAEVLIEPRMCLDENNTRNFGDRKFDPMITTFCLVNLLVDLLAGGGADGVVREFHAKTPVDF